MATYIGTDANNNVTYQVEPDAKKTMLPNMGVAKFQDEIAQILETVTTYKGQPVVVTSAEDMTEETVIYLYMGDEEGYNADHWYYYDTETETWTDGGAYVANPVIIDDTLTQAGKAADAKATGDEITQLKSDLSAFENLANGRSITLKWRNGTFNTQNGSVASSSTRILCGTFYVTKGYIEADDGYDIIVATFNPTTRVYESATSWVKKHTFSTPTIGFVQMRKSDNSNITPTIASHLKYILIDKTYSEELDYGGYYSRLGINKLPEDGYIRNTVLTSTGQTTSDEWDISPLIPVMPRDRVRVRRFENDDYADYSSIMYAFYNASGMRVSYNTSWPVSVYNEVWFMRVNIKKTGNTVITINDDLPAEYSAYTPEETTQQKIDAVETKIEAAPGSQWEGKKWYAYGTSLTNISSEGKYAKYVRDLSGLLLTNKGISGGAICNNANIRNAVMNTSDGKLEADLITLEVGANDTSAPLGTIYDTGTDTFCGALNQCIRYLQANTTAQIVVISSTNARKNNNDSSAAPEVTYGSDNHTKYDQWKATQDVCAINSCYYIPMGESANMSYARMNASNDYNVDNIHHTELGGYNCAQFVWSRLKNIPLWYTSIPS